MSRLPSGYTEVEYIESTGTQYIETGVTGAAKSEYVIAFTNVTTRKLMGYSTASYNYWGVNGGNFEVEQDSYNYTSCVLNTPYDIIFEYTTAYVTLKVNEYPTQKWDRSYALSGSLCLLSLHGEFGMSAKLYSCVITQGSAVVRDFIPCINPNGVIGMYDIVNGVFYGNSGSGTFIAGPVVSSNTIKVYNGSEWVDGTPYVYTSNGWVEADTVYVYTNSGWVEKT